MSFYDIITVMDKAKSLQALQVIPGIGKEMSEDLYNLGFRRVSDLKTKIQTKCTIIYVSLREFGLTLVFCTLLSARYILQLKVGTTPNY